MMVDYPKTPEEARRRVIELMNNVIQVDEPFARLLVEHKFDVPDSIMDAEGKNEVQVVVTQNPEGKWVTSTLGVINGILEALGCGRIMARMETEDFQDDRVISIIDYVPWRDKCKRGTLVELEDQNFLDGVNAALEGPKRDE